MNIKSLLLGSAAALLAVSGARAADAVEVVAEPEPMDYVRICDTYGAGFYYIPGTETCLKVGGFVRYQIDMGNEQRFTSYRNGSIAMPGHIWPTDRFYSTRVEDSDYGWQKATTVSIQLDSRTETEFGTLKGFLDVRAGNGGPAAIDSAYIELGGLHMGRSGNAFDYGFGGEQDILGGATVNRIAYTFTGGNGFSASISIDDDGDVISGAGAFDAVAQNVYGRDTRSGADFVPNVSGNIQYAAGPIAVGVYAAYDNETDEGAVKGLLAYSFTENDKLSIGGYWQSGPTYVLGGGISQNVVNAMSGLVDYGTLYRGADIPTAGEWSVQGEYWHRFNEKLAMSVGGGYISNIGFLDDVNTTVNANSTIFNIAHTHTITGADIDAQLNMWRVGSTVDYVVTPGFNIKTSVNYNQYTGDAVDAIDASTAGDDEFGKGFVNGFVRFQRDF